VSQPNGAVVWSWISDAFGDSEPNEDPDGDGETFTLNLRFAGQYFDAETGLHQNWWRSYSPENGRYVTSDPIGLNGGLNTYSYAKTNPVKFNDPLGLYPPGGPICGSGISELLIPDTFPNSCQQHDECYGTCGKSRFECDFQFLISAIWECSRGALNPGCFGSAGAYYAGIRTGGEIPYKKAQEDANCEPNCE